MPSTRSQLAQAIARSLALRAFRGHWDRDTLVADAHSTAYELELSTPSHVSASCIGWVAVRRVRVGRQHKESVRSLTGRFDKGSKRPKNLRQIQIDLHDVACPEQPPSETVPGWLDYQTWLAGLDARKRAIASALAAGGSTGETAREFGVSDGRISQLRRELESDYKSRFQSAN